MARVGITTLVGWDVPLAFFARYRGRSLLQSGNYVDGASLIGALRRIEPGPAGFGPQDGTTIGR
jgi:hypothetical protein